MRIKTRRKRSAYKSEANYIRAVYVSNKKKIMKNISDSWIKKGIKAIKLKQGKSEEEAEKISEEEIAAARENSKFIYKQFKGLVAEKMKYTNPKTKKDYTASEAIRILKNSKDLNNNWTTGDVYSRNFYNLIKKEKEVKRKFFENEGLKTRINYKKFEFLGYYLYNGKENAVYKYGNSYFLEAKSPKDRTGASLTFMTEYEFDNNNNITFSKWRKG